MKKVTIHRDENANEWVVLVTDTIRETKETHRVPSIQDAEAIAEKVGAHKTKVMLR